MRYYGTNRGLQRSNGVKTCIILCLLLLFSLFYLRCFDFILKSGTFGVPGVVVPGRWTAHGTNPGHPGESGTGGNPTLTPDPTRPRCDISPYSQYALICYTLTALASAADDRSAHELILYFQNKIRKIALARDPTRSARLRQI